MHYNLSVIKEILGAEYQIFRLRQDACLDRHTDNVWNCVAIFQLVLQLVGYAGHYLLNKGNNTPHCEPSEHVFLAVYERHP
jgi:hypothetical protein